MSDEIEPRKVEHRRERMRAELAQEGIPILGGAAYSEALRGDAEQTDLLVVEELVNARHSPAHEGVRPRYGCLIVPSVEGLPENVRAAMHTVEADSSPARLQPLVDGESTVIVRDLAGRSGVARMVLGSELQVVDALRATSGVSVQRLDDGRLRVGTQAGIALNDGGDWTLRPSAGTVVSELHRQLSLDGDDRRDRMASIRTLIEFCLHSLSPSGIGATLIVSLTGDTDVLLPGTSDRGAEPPLELNVFDRKEQGLLRNLLAANDGACLIDAHGRLRRFKAKLKASERAIQLMSEFGGTRHTSAKRFSFDYPDALVIVVSADGPVTVFNHGAKVSRSAVDAGGKEPSWVSFTPAEVRRSVRPETRQDQCVRCGTPHVLKVWAPKGERSRGTDSEPETDATFTDPVACLACGNTLTDVSGAVRVEIRVRHSWEPD